MVIHYDNQVAKTLKKLNNGLNSQNFETWKESIQINNNVNDTLNLVWHHLFSWEPFFYRTKLRAWITNYFLILALKK